MEERELIKELCNIGAIKFGEFLLKSGKKSPYYVDLRILPSYPKVLKHSGKILGQMILGDANKPDVLCGVPAAGLAIATAISLETGIPTFYTKKEPIVYKELSKHLDNLLRAKEEDGGFAFDEKAGVEAAIEIIDKLSGMKPHGIARYADGDFQDQARIGIVDDLITTAESKLEARDLILLEAKRRKFNVEVTSVYVLLDREQGGKESLKKEGIELHSVATVRKAADWLRETGDITHQMHETIVNYTMKERKAIDLT
jgi:uridine monophosphate synthetase